MNTTTLITPPPAPSAQLLRETRNHRRPGPERPTFAEMLDGILPLVGFVAVAGPSVVFVAGPYLLFVLMLTGPFLLLVTFALVAAIIVALTGAIPAPPYLLVRHLLRHRTRQQNLQPLMHQLRQTPADGHQPGHPPPWHTAHQRAGRPARCGLAFRPPLADPR